MYLCRYLGHSTCEISNFRRCTHQSALMVSKFVNCCFFGLPGWACQNILRLENRAGFFFLTVLALAKAPWMFLSISVVSKWQMSCRPPPLCCSCAVCGLLLHAQMEWGAMYTDSGWSCSQLSSASVSEVPKWGLVAFPPISPYLSFSDRIQASLNVV